MICIDRTRGKTQTVRLGYGVTVSLCAGARQRRVSAAAKRARLRAHAARGVAGMRMPDRRQTQGNPRPPRQPHRADPRRPRPGSYAWPELRRRLEHGYAAGARPADLADVVHTPLRHLPRTPTQPPHPPTLAPPTPLAPPARPRAAAATIPRPGDASHSTSTAASRGSPIRTSSCGGRRRPSASTRAGCSSIPSTRPSSTPALADAPVVGIALLMARHRRDADAIAARHRVGVGGPLPRRLRGTPRRSLPRLARERPSGSPTAASSSRADVLGTIGYFLADDDRADRRASPRPPLPAAPRAPRNRPGGHRRRPRQAPAPTTPRPPSPTPSAPPAAASRPPTATPGECRGAPAPGTSLPEP